MSTPSDTCTTCCTCPQPAILWDIAAIAGFTCGHYVNPDEMPSGFTPCSNFFRTKRLDVSLTSSGGDVNTWSGEQTYPVGSVLWTVGEEGCSPAMTDSWAGTTNAITGACAGSSGELPGDLFQEPTQDFVSGGFSGDYYTDRWRIASSEGICEPDSIDRWRFSAPTYTAGTGGSVIHEWAPLGGTTGHFKVVYENPITFADTAAAFIAREVTFVGDYSTSPSQGKGNALHLGECWLDGALRRARYYFELPHAMQVGVRDRYRLTWVERTMPFLMDSSDPSSRGIAVDGISLIEPGDYLPDATVAAPPTGGVQILLCPVMSSGGAVASLNILNPGSGYTDGTLAVTIESAPNHTGVTATGWTLTISGGQAVSFTAGTGGNYLPKAYVENPGTSGGACASVLPTTEAVIAVTMNPQGGIASLTITDGGSGYFANCRGTFPVLVISPATISANANAMAFIHMGTEVERCHSHDARFQNRVIAPLEGYFSVLDMPEDNGMVCSVDNVYGVCNDSTACPE